MNRISISLSFLMMLSLSGCVETMTMDSDGTDLPVVVNCIMDFNISGLEGDVISLTLQYAKSKYSSGYTPVEDAVVYMKCTDGSYSHRIDFVHTEGCVWESVGHDTVPLLSLGERCVLHVEIPGRDPVISETVTPTAIRIGNEGIRSDKVMTQLVVSGDNPDNYCLWFFAKMNDRYIDYLVTDNPYADDFNLVGRKYSDLSFDGTPSGSYGELFLLAFEEAKREFSDMSLHEGFVRIGNLTYDKPFFIFPGPLSSPGQSFSQSSDTPTLRYFLVSEDLDRYYRSVYVHNYMLDSYLTHVYSTNDLYSNIHGGLGIFGCRLIGRSIFLTEKYYPLYN